MSDISDYFGLQGRLTITHRDTNGNIISSETFENTIVDEGLSYIAKLLIGEVTRAFTHIQIGTGGVSLNAENQQYVRPPAPSNTSLYTYYAEGAAYKTMVKVNAVGNPGDQNYTPFIAIARFQHTFTFSEDVNISEAGIFNNTRTQSPTMLSHKTFWTRTLLNGHSLDVSWDIGITRFPKSL